MASFTSGSLGVLLRAADGEGGAGDSLGEEEPGEGSGSTNFFGAPIGEISIGLPRRVVNDDSDREKALGFCLKELPESAQQLLQKKYEENLSFAEIATLLESSSSALMMKASRIRAKLAKCIEQRLREGMGES